MKLSRRIIALLLVALMVTACLACSKKEAATGTEAASADDDWGYIKGKGVLVVGITEYEPMNYYDENGELIGFDTEFTQAVCNKLGLTPEFIVIDWDTKELELSSKNIDCIWNGLTVTEERKANMNFTEAYLENQQVVVVRAADAASYPDTASFAGKKAVAESGSAGETAIKTDMADAEFIAVAAQSDALLEVKAGTADAAVIDMTMAKAMVGEGTDYAELTILNIDMMGEEYAIGFRVGSNATAEVNKAISELRTDGTMKTLAEKYDLSDLLIG